MNICFVMISDGWGGAENVVYELAKGLIREGHKVGLIINEELIDHYRDLEGIVLLNIGPWFTLNSYKNRLTHMPNPIRKSISTLLNYVAEFLRRQKTRKLKTFILDFIMDQDMEIVHSHGAEADLFISSIGDVSALPIMTTIHGEHALIGSVPISLMLKPLYVWKSRKFHRALDKMNRIVTVCNSERESLIEWSPKLANKMAVIYNGVDVKDIQSRKICDRKSTEDTILLFPGGSKWIKGGDILIEAIAESRCGMRNLHLFIALDVPQNDPLRQKVSKLGLSKTITFVGLLSRGDFLDMLSLSDILIVPSRFEAFPIVLLEAMALGKAIIATNVGGISEVIKDGRNGILTHPNSSEIASAIVKIAGKKEIADKFREKNLIDIMNFDWKEIIRQYREIYESQKCPSVNNFKYIS